MPFDFTEFLTLAEALSGRPDEASKRSSISRAYYAAFHVAFSRAEANVGSYRARPVQYQRMPTHAWCWLQYINTNDVTCQRIGLNGDRMKKRRTDADYEKKDIVNLQAEVQRQIADVRQLLQDIAALNPNYPRP